MELQVEERGRVAGWEVRMFEDDRLFQEGRGGGGGGGGCGYEVSLTPENL